MVTESNPLSSGENGSFLTQWTSKEAGIPGYGLFCDALLEKPVNVIPPLAPVKSPRKQQVCSNCGLQEHPITSWTNTVIRIGTRTRSHYRSAASSLDMLFFILAVVERKSFMSLGETSASWLSNRLPQLWKHNLQWKHLSYKINKSSNPSIKNRYWRKPSAKAIKVPLGFKGSSCHILKKAKDSWETIIFTKTLPPTGPAVYSRSTTSHRESERERDTKHRDQVISFQTITCPIAIISAQFSNLCLSLPLPVIVSIIWRLPYLEDAQYNGGWEGRKGCYWTWATAIEQAGIFPLLH